MERVKKGERYWYISLKDGNIRYATELYLPINDKSYSIGNYFHTEEEAEAMARKLRAVLKGADVIEVPSATYIKYTIKDGKIVKKEYVDEI